MPSPSYPLENPVVCTDSCTIACTTHEECGDTDEYVCSNGECVAYCKLDRDVAPAPTL
jgi:hypothetical protein